SARSATWPAASEPHRGTDHEPAFQLPPRPSARGPNRRPAPHRVVPRAVRGRRGRAGPFLSLAGGQLAPHHHRPSAAVGRGRLGLDPPPPLPPPPPPPPP